MSRVKETSRPTYRCTVDGCPFTTTAFSPKGRKIAIAKHHKETGHTKLSRIVYDEDPQELNF